MTSCDCKPANVCVRQNEATNYFLVVPATNVADVNNTQQKKKAKNENEKKNSTANCRLGRAARINFSQTAAFVLFKVIRNFHGEHTHT